MDMSCYRAGPQAGRLSLKSHSKRLKDSLSVYFDLGVWMSPRETSCYCAGPQTD